MKGDIDARLHDLRSAVEEARSVPMSASVMINRADFLDLLGSLERAIDQTLSQATEVVGDREAVLAEGVTQAEEIVRAAEAEREVLVSDTDVYRLAVARAAEITEEAERGARELQAETDQYVEEKLANLELTLERTLDQMRTGHAAPAEAQLLGDRPAAVDLPGATPEEKQANFERTLQRTIEVLRKGRARLSGGHVHGLGDDTDVAQIQHPDHLER